MHLYVMCFVIGSFGQEGKDDLALGVLKKMFKMNNPARNIDTDFPVGTTPTCKTLGVVTCL